MLGIVDRHVSFGGPIGPVASEVKAACYQSATAQKSSNLWPASAGATCPSAMFDQMFDALFETKKTGVVPQPAFIGLRE